MLNKIFWLSLFGVLLVLTSCVPLQDSTFTPVTPNPPTPIPEPTFEFSQDIQIQGEVVVLEHLNLSFPISGPVLELSVEQGDFVQTGNLIAMLDTRQLIADINRAEGELALAQARLDRASTGPHEAEIQEAAIAVTSIASQRVWTIATATAQASDIAVAQARLDLLLAQPFPEDVAVAEAEVKQAQLNLESSQARLELATLTAPTDGTVTEVYVNAYEYASIGQPIVQISNLSEMTAQFEMDDLEVVNLKIGDTMPVTFEALPGVEAIGRVVGIMPNDRGDRDFIVLFGLETVPEGVLWGMTAEIIIPQE
jgi:multidrug efflux pump subunit AcrA (membrane-fusion protein)